MSKYLFISSHCDDTELSCGATIDKLMEFDNDLTVITMSHIYDVGDIAKEFCNSMQVLGVTKYILHDFTTRLFYTQQNDILQILYSEKENNYNFVYAPSSKDLHSDHSTVGKCAERVFKTSNLITYKADWNTKDRQTNYFQRVEQRHVEQKIKALECYKSQKHRAYMNPDYILANALNTGVMAGCKYSESFNAINLIS